jgi:hypothetical protein
MNFLARLLDSCAYLTLRAAAALANVSTQAAIVVAMHADCLNCQLEFIVSTLQRRRASAKRNREKEGKT